MSVKRLMNSTGRNAEVGRVKGLLNPRDIKPIPGAPSFILGMVELDGHWIPVLDMGTPLDESSRCVMVVENNIDGVSEMFGIVADYIDEAASHGCEQPGDMGELPNGFPYRDVAAAVSSTVDELCDIIEYQKILATHGLEDTEHGIA